MTIPFGCRTLGVSLLAVGLAASGGLATGAPAEPAEGHRITGPFHHQNLSIFLIHGADRIQSRNVLTLQEAIDQNKVRVHETGEVNQLSAENLSSDADVYVHAGDIVKGGQQDRMITRDLIVPPKSGRMPIGSFCVEQGRWSRRGSESVAAFDSASDLVAGNALKIAAQRKGDQREVWKEVEAAQDRLKLNAGAAPSRVSPSSFQLTLEDESVAEKVKGYVTALAGSGGGRDVVGVAFVINDRISSVEIYASRGLFAKLWPKLLKAAAVDALAEGRGAAPGRTLSAADIKAWLAEADRARGEEKTVSPRVKLITREGDSAMMFETLDRERKEAWVHRSYLAK